jgi:hypothetical protein
LVDDEQQEGKSHPDAAASLAEFNGLRAEILHRVGAQGRLVQLNLTALAAVAGLIITNHATPNLLLVMPVFSAGMAFAWLEHMRQLTLIGNYIDKELWPFLSKVAGADLPSWERTWSNANPTLILQITGSLEPAVLLAGPPIFALAVSFVSIYRSPLLPLWISDLVFVVALSLFALWFAWQQIRPRWAQP